MLEGEALKRIDFTNIPVVNVDDHSSDSQQKLGREICKKYSLDFLINSKKGLQYSVDKGIRHLADKYGCEWAFVLQQDIFPAEDRFFTKFTRLLNEYDLEKLGALGFNVLDRDNSFTINSYEDFKKGKRVKAFLGSFFLSDTKENYKRMSLKWLFITSFLDWFGTKKYKEKSRLYKCSKRVFCEKQFYNFKKVSKLYDGIFSCELPVWAGIAINTQLWKENVEPSTNFVFHLWFNDVAMQFLSKNINMAVISDLYLLNDQKIKNKYGFSESSADAGIKGETIHVEKYGQHLFKFKEKWGFSYEDSRLDLENVIERYSGTLIEDYYRHNCRQGPLFNYPKK